ncbi:hypothetical protein EON63_17605 [archaeon]|nr:MAG: hypothetical protein EON63_17605 [archaeon]
MSICKPCFILIFIFAHQALDWYTSLTKHVRYQNSEALAQQCRLPEVVEWYYQLQADLNRKHSFLLKNTEVYLIFPSAKIEGENVVSIFNVAVRCMGVSLHSIAVVFALCLLYNTLYSL